MPLFYCDIEGCNNAAQRAKAGYCEFCNRHFCEVHIKGSCCLDGDRRTAGELDRKAWQDELARLAARIDVAALQQRASDLRNGISCTIPALQKENLFVGTINWHIPITFTDGVVWLCRIPLTTARAPPQAAQDQSLLSEFGTYRFLASIGVPVPAVVEVFISTPSNPGVGASYLLMEKVAGKWLDWDRASDEAKSYVLEQLAEVYAKIKSHPLPSIGSLYCSDDYTTIYVGPIADATFNDIREDGTLSSFGPFTSVLDYAKNVLQQRLDRIVARECWHEYAVDGYLFHRFLLDNVNSLPIVKEGKDGEFYFFHGESKGDHIMVDEDYKIVGIIDCEWSQTSTAPIAFAAPHFLIEWNMYADGITEPTPGDKQFTDILEAKGYTDLARHARQTRFARGWAFIVLNDEVFERIFFNAALGMVKLCGEECSQTSEEGEQWLEWRQKMLRKYAYDDGLQSLLSAH
ncbi:hypothetical protein OF83DRAFT_1071909 [Amylostereum chailletii]|nr:hypothetical protein OF83DRAFT_1071909 [Amylostereum chailletii]